MVGPRRGELAAAAKSPGGTHGDHARRFRGLHVDVRIAQEKAQLLSKLISRQDPLQSAQRSEIESRILALQQNEAQIKQQAQALLLKNDPDADPNDTNYIFLNFMLSNLPIGLIGLLIAAILSASMSSTSAELNALASTTVVDVYKRIFKKQGSEAHYVKISKISTVVWGIYAILLAEYASRLGSLIEAVNILGSLFYGTILGIFLVAFYLKWVRGTATFYAALIAESLVVLSFMFTHISFLWYNVIGCFGVIIFSMLFTWMGNNSGSD